MEIKKLTIENRNSGDLYAKLLHTPLFVGMSQDELRTIMAKVRMDFGKFEPGSVIINSGERCGSLLIITDGDVEYTTTSDNGLCSVLEPLSAPLIVQPDSIFGRYQVYTHTVTAVSKVSTISIDKNEVLKLLAHSLIFRLNLSGFLSTALQKQQQKVWLNAPDSIEKRIILFFADRVTTPVGKKIFKVSQQTIADYLNDIRLNISFALRSLRDRGLLEMARGKVVIEDMHQLLQQM